MMIEQHYDDEVLAAFLAEPVDQLSRDKHLASCALCRQTLDSLRAMTAALHERTVWEDEPISGAPRPETINFLRRLQATMAAEDIVAEAYVKQLLAGPRETWAAKLDAHPEWRTAGTVRKLIAATDRYNFSSPLDAVELTRLTTDIAESLPADGAGTRERLAADAWREYAYALLVTGGYDAATVALVHAECCATEDRQYAQARNSLMRALVLRGKEQWADAVRLARFAAAEFLRYGDVSKYCSARMTEAITLYDSRQFRDAVAVYDEMRTHHPNLAQETVALAIHNEGLCHRELDDFSRAERCFVAAVTVAEELNMQGLRAKARWHLARLLMRQAKYDAALQLLEPVRDDLEQLGLANDVACSALDVAECLLAVDRPADVEGLCRSAISYFARVELQSSTGAMTALAYIQEAAASRNLRVEDLATVRVFIESLPKKPHSLFARPAAES